MARSLTSCTLKREAEVQEQERVDGPVPEAEGAGGGAARVDRGRVLERGGEEGEHALVDGDLPGVGVDVAGDEVVEQAAVAGFVDHRGRSGRDGCIGPAGLRFQGLGWRLAPSVPFVLAREARVRGVARLVPRVRGLVRAVAAGEAHEQVLLVDELVARVVGHRVHAGVHPDGVAGAGLDAEAAEDAAQLVDDERLGEALVAAARVALRVLGGLDGDALRRARGRAAEAGDAARASRRRGA